MEINPAMRDWNLACGWNRIWKLTLLRMLKTQGN
jgi:hypothetical protein